ncbi:MAG: 6-bladed beta-propeller [Mariniphaga sp.]|nr:6-bladed beta-propeller [Mariniphaga sp.]
MKKHLIFIGLVVFSFFSCQMADEKRYVNLNLTEEPSVLDFFSEIKVVQLETKEDNLLGVISKVAYYKDRFFILDGLTQQFFCFDGQGKLKYKISAQGKGPGEYNYITDFTIDPEGERIFILDPVVQKVLLFCLDGNHLATFSVPTEKGMGFNKVFALNDSIILLTSITNYQLVFFDLNQHKVVEKKFEFPIEGPLDAFSPRHNVYQYKGRTFVLQYLGNVVYEITELDTLPHFKWDFGPGNNSKEQIERLISKIGSRQNDIASYHDEVGKGKILNHHIVKVYETSRFKIALIEYDNNFRHVFIDKTSNDSRVFNHFTEEISLIYFFVQPDVAIGFNTGIPDRTKHIPERAHRKYGFYHTDLLNPEDRQIIENHNPMTDNPFLVVYKFRE